MKSAQCANHELSQPRGSTDEKLQVCQSGLSQRRGSPQQHATLWCQAGFRKCANLSPGTYQAEADGDKALQLYVYSIVFHKMMGKMKYRVVGSW